ncbi:MAG TPA: cytochrome-c oxidase, cbb3-type subunit III [Usitatibacter sp.]|nr:cytochrome-c oxidase, cbb3-type subunit III [Usitatibacter sp.]
MSDFTSGFWSLFVGGVTLVSIVACALLLASMSKRKVSTDPEKTGHVWDEDLAEYNNPLPRWWIYLFWITIFFGLGYLVVFPGLGTFQGAAGWTSASQYQDEVKVAERLYGPLYQKFAATDVKALASDPQARAAGEKLFLNYCAQCHASDARGGKGFPNLTDDDWLYGGEPEVIKTTILDGRNGMMPAWGPVLKEEGVKDVANFVRSLSGLSHDAARAERGKATFATYCVACHGPEGKGNTAMGAPNLTDQIWLYGSSEAALIETISKGRNNKMPAHRDLLGEPRVHVLAAYVYGLSHGDNAKNLVPAAGKK